MPLNIHEAAAAMVPIWQMQKLRPTEARLLVTKAATCQALVLGTFRDVGILGSAQGQLLSSPLFHGYKD